MIKLIVGLGNPGQQYAATRHNAGAWYAEALAKANHVTFKSSIKLHAKITDFHSGANRCLVAIPSDFMNLSGTAVQALSAYYNVKPEELLIAHDELDIDPGVMRFKFAGGHGGHNGLRDIIGKLGTKDFWRLRVGIGHPGSKDRVTPYVLGKVDADSQITIERGIDNILRHTDAIIAADFAKLMNELH